MKTIPDSPAFPTKSNEGISTRTYIAAHAMQGLLAADVAAKLGEKFRDKITDSEKLASMIDEAIVLAAVSYADALIEKLNMGQRNQFPEITNKQTPDNWARKHGVKIMSSDGWMFGVPDKNIKPKSIDDPISEEEFIDRAKASTVCCL